MINVYDERNHRNLEQLIKTTIRRRQKTTVIDISDTEDENDDKNDDNETDTESDINVTNDHWYLIVIDLKNLRCFALDSNHGYKIYDEKKELEPSPLEGARIEKCTQILSFLCLYVISDMCKYLNENVD